MNAGLNTQQNNKYLAVPDDVWQAFMQEPAVVWLPAPVPYLMSKGSWVSIVTALSWARGRRSIGRAQQRIAKELGFPNIEWVQKMLGSGCVGRVKVALPSSSDITLRPADAAFISELLKAHASTILANLTTDLDPAEFRFALEDTTLRLDVFASSSTQPGPSQVAKIRARSLIHAVFAASRLRNRGEIVKVMTNIAIAQFGGQQSRAASSAKSVVCDSSTISRAQVLIDTAFCCHMQSEFAEDAHSSADKRMFFMFADSSPLHGHDWLLSTLVRVRGRDLDAVCEAARLLKSSSNLFSGEEPTPEMYDMAQRRDAAQQTVARCMQFHKQVPVALGSGASSVLHKLKCIVQKMWPETQQKDLLLSVLSRSRGACLDMGTEAEWMASMLDLEPDAKGPVDGATIGAAKESPWTLHNCLLSPGACHIMHNLAADVGQQLHWFASFLDGFRALMYLFSRQHLRERFIATCSMKTLFTAACPAHSEWRWGTLHGALKYLLPRRQALQSAWDQQTFLDAHRDGQRQNLDDTDTGLPNLAMVTQTIRSNMWWAYAEMLRTAHDCLAAICSLTEDCECHGWLSELPADHEQVNPEKVYSL